MIFILRTNVYRHRSILTKVNESCSCTFDVVGQIRIQFFGDLSKDFLFSPVSTAKSKHIFNGTHVFYQIKKPIYSDHSQIVKSSEVYLKVLGQITHHG